jgi:hypothetical protein
MSGAQTPAQCARSKFFGRARSTPSARSRKLAQEGWRAAGRVQTGDGQRLDARRRDRHRNGERLRGQIRRQLELEAAILVEEIADFAHVAVAVGEGAVCRGESLIAVVAMRVAVVGEGVRGAVRVRVAVVMMGAAAAGRVLVPGVMMMGRREFVQAVAEHRDAAVNGEQQTSSQFLR